jgi:hypothetical protein
MTCTTTWVGAVARPEPEPHPPVWPFPTYKGQPYKPPARRRLTRKQKLADLPDALF